jgi:hypothetical protein
VRRVRRPTTRSTSQACITSVDLMGGCLMGMYLTGVYLMGVHLMGMYLTGVHLIGIHFMGMHLIGVHLIGVYLMGVYLIGVHMGMHFMDVYMFPNSKKGFRETSGSPTLQTVVDLSRSERRVLAPRDIARRSRRTHLWLIISGFIKRPYKRGFLPCR